MPWNITTLQKQQIIELAMGRDFQLADWNKLPEAKFMDL